MSAAVPGVLAMVAGALVLLAISYEAWRTR